MRYWIAVACKEHVMKGVAGGFAQVCHGKPGPLEKMEENDWIVYYSPKVRFLEKIPYRAFTAIGQIQKNPLYPFQMSEEFRPYRRDVTFFPAKEASVLPLIPKLSFITNKQNPGFKIIADEMLA